MDQEASEPSEESVSLLNAVLEGQGPLQTDEDRTGSATTLALETARKLSKGSSTTSFDSIQVKPSPPLPLPSDHQPPMMPMATFQQQQGPDATVQNQAQQISGLCPNCASFYTQLYSTSGRPQNAVQKLDDADSFTPRVRSDKRSIIILLGTFFEALNGLYTFCHMMSVNRKKPSYPADWPIAKSMK